MFSVIIPLYNKASYIEKAIRSVAAQTCRDFELIVIDDGSKDGGFEIAKKLLAALTPPLGGWGATCQSNQGVSVTRNNGVKLAKYDYIAFLDADDWWAPTYLEEMKNLIVQYPEAGIYASSYYKVKNGKHIQANIGVGEGFQQGLINYFQVYAKTLWMPLWTGATVIKKNVFHENNGFKPTLKLGEDFDLWVRVALKYPVAFLNKSLAYYNQDVVLDARAVGARLYEKNEHMLFTQYDKALDDDSDFVFLLERLSLYSLIPYYIANKNKAEVEMLIDKINWSNHEFKYYIYYKFLSPNILKIWFDFLKFCSVIKQKIKRFT